MEKKKTSFNCHISPNDSTLTRPSKLVGDEKCSTYLTLSHWDDTSDVFHHFRDLFVNWSVWVHSVLEKRDFYFNRVDGDRRKK